MSDQEEAILLVQELEDKRAHSGESGSVKEIADILSRLAVSLRNGDTRDALSASSLPSHLSEILRKAYSHVDSSLSIIEQTGRAAANLAANCDVARDGLVAAGYVQNCCQILDECCEDIDQSLSAVKALTVSLLNMVIEGHEKSLGELSRNVLALVKMSSILLDRLGNEDDGEQILQWIWTIFSLVLDAHPNPVLIPHLILPFTIYSNDETTPPPMPILSSSSELLDTWCNAENINIEAFSSQVPPIADFVEYALWRGNEDDEEGSDSKALAGIKGTLINALVGLSSFLPPAEVEFWRRMEKWLPISERDDLQCCAILSYGNRAREDSSAIELLPIVLPAIRQLLQPESNAQLLHSVIGLLRNLSIPEANKVILGQTDLLDKLVEVGVWSTEKDMLGSVQGGAVGIVKNLCRGNASNSSSVAHHSAVLGQILALLQRTDDAAIRFEATRVLVNCIRSISSDTAERATLAKFEDGKIISSLLDMFKESGPYPVLANESIIALALLATFGSNDTAAAIGNGLSDLMERIVDALAPKEGDEAASKEVRANLVTLLRQVDGRGAEPRIVTSVRTALEAAVGTGRTISEEGGAL